MLDKNSDVTFAHCYYSGKSEIHIQATSIEISIILVSLCVLLNIHFSLDTILVQYKYEYKANLY